MKKQLTLCLIYKHPKILLGMKKRGFGVGRWNGFGGKVSENETVEEAAIRELKEEANIEATNISKIGILSLGFENDPKILEMHVFWVSSFKGEIQESEEMRPEWFSVEDIPYDDMWSSDMHWYPIFLSGKKFRGRFLFDKPSDAEYSAKILEKELLEVDNLD